MPSAWPNRCYIVQTATEIWDDNLNNAFEELKAAIVSEIEECQNLRSKQTNMPRH